jgi:hypothetical protein
MSASLPKYGKEKILSFCHATKDEFTDENVVRIKNRRREYTE